MVIRGISCKENNDVANKKKILESIGYNKPIVWEQRMDHINNSSNGEMKIKEARPL